MSSAKRRINSTGRKKIPHSRIDLRILSTVPGEPLKARLGLDLASLNLPSSAALSVEAYHRSSTMRFDCGTIGSKKIPDVLTLNEIDQSGAVLFRIKVIDQGASRGKILASADRVRPSIEGENEGRKSIFPVEYRDLGQEIWRVEIDDDAGPLLLLNSKVPALMNRIYDNPLVAGTLLPAAFRLVLQYLAKEPAEDDEDGVGWKAEWKRFCTEALGIEDDLDDMDEEDEREKWVEDAVRRYCESRLFVDKSKEQGHV
jgi:hypothetical protein